MMTEALFLLRLIKEKISQKVNTYLLYIFFLYATFCNLCTAILHTISDICIVGLKKVTSDMQTHKNPALRSGPAPFKAPTVNTMKTVLPANAPIDKPSVFTRDGKKWLVV